MQTQTSGGSQAERALAAAAAKRNIDINALSGGFSAPDKAGPLVYYGGGGKQRADGDVGRMYGGKPVGQGAKTKTLEESNAEFYKMTEKQLIELQRRLVAAGILDPNKVRIGQYDDETYQAYSALNERAAKFYAVGRKITPSDVLNMVGAAYRPEDDVDEQGRDLAAQRRALIANWGTSVNTYNRSDPASVREGVERAFTEVLGRKPSKEQAEKFVSSMLGQERANQALGFAVGDDLERASRQRQLTNFDAEAGMAQQNAARGPSVPGDEEGMSEAQILMARLQRFIADAPGKIGLGKTTRSYEEQVRLYNNYKAGKGPLAAKPGTSKHGNGRANDLKYENDAVRQWALANASKYGLAFPIYDPKKKRSHDESWHIEVMQGPGMGKGRAAPATGGQTPVAGTAPISVDVTNQGIDMGAQAREFARNENPVETAAFDIGGQFKNFLSILNGGSM